MIRDPLLEPARARVLSAAEGTHAHALDLGLQIRRAQLRDAVVDAETHAELDEIARTFGNLTAQIDRVRTRLAIASARSANDPAPPALQVIEGGRSGR